ncbi:MAG: N-acetylmuramoyl-L-alanine amidase CwlD [Epulopiscium sp.]|nr:N-acetylmuramoyl-L-alanine amidase CwlD [Candidatus Epulonipiscium sp.]
MEEKKLKIVASIAVVFIFGIIYFKYANSAIESFSLATASKTIVIDAGHGGFDPGKVGISGVLEKDINLQIALKLRDYLEQSGAYVIMTRTEDVDLDGDDNKKIKKADMINRTKKANDNEADILVSIHQNAFSQSNVKGGQVFYHDSSEEGKRLANHIQKAIKDYADKDNNRLAKHNGDYYVLRATSSPSVIVECGFLTNREEESKLMTDEYQEKIAWAVYIGIVEYFQETIDSQ